MTRWPLVAHRCRVHGAGCSVPWGYDPAHTDSGRPYTVAELADRDMPPHFYAYPSHEEYQAGWHLWRALRRDSRPTTAERSVAQRARFLAAGFNVCLVDEFFPE